MGNITGLPQIFAKIQRKIGFKSYSISFYEHKYKYKKDIFYIWKIDYFNLLNAFKFSIIF